MIIDEKINPKIDGFMRNIYKKKKFNELEIFLVFDLQFTKTILPHAYVLRNVICLVAIRECFVNTWTIKKISITKVMTDFIQCRKI